MRTVREIQIALRQRGYDPGPADGILGRRTIAAIKTFQKDQKIAADGIAGTVTLSRLFPTGSTTPSREVLTPWYAEATRNLGVREIAGKQHSSTIQKWLERLKASWRDDETAWCGTFCGWCIATTLPNEPLPSNPFGARNWIKFGRALAQPAIGAIAVFWRGSKDGWQGHVGFVAGISADGKKVLIRGGNQGNAVSDAWLATDRLLGYRWPSSAPLPSGSRIPVSTVGGALSTNEA